jgi:hypothetical protein
MWWSAEEHFSGRPLVRARTRDSLAMPTLPQKCLYGETSLGLLARMFHSGIGESAERKADS